MSVFIARRMPCCGKSVRIIRIVKTATKTKDMEIKYKVWCLFEQSGVFKNEFKKLGYDAVDVDIQNNFNETDYQI